jgi:hypothetical protein
MSRTIKIHYAGITDLEFREVTIEEAITIMNNEINRGAIVVDPKTNETIWEIKPEVDEIEIVEFVGGG